MQGIRFCSKKKIVNEPNKTEDLILVIEVFKEENRNKGIASDLVQHIISEARRNGSYQIIAYYQKNNIPSHKLWIKNSFSIISVKNPVTQMVSCIATYKIQFYVLYDEFEFSGCVVRAKDDHTMKLIEKIFIGAGIEWYIND